MKKHLISLSLALFSFGVMNFFYGQENSDIINWYNGKGPGMNTEKAYKSLKKKKSTTVIVAVIDSGIDIEHKDLKGKIWVNEDEIPNNGIDDDNNGYIDDVNGWNFLGSPGQNQKYARLEKTRIYADLMERFDNKTEDQVPAAEKEDYTLYKTLKSEIEEERNGNLQALEQYLGFKEMLPEITRQLKMKLGENFTKADVEKMEAKTPEDMQLKQLGMYIASGQLTEESVNEGIAYLDGSANYQLNPQYNDRQFIGDNPHDFNDTQYGNNDVEGPDALHGTHVGGIIGAVRGNGIGGDGVAENIKLMSVRAVPDGDEQDKDIALAIRYAVDNGASVINMSFGKGYSMHQQEVYDALAYADSKGVLLVHAAGNDGQNVDVKDNFPSSAYSFQTKKLDNYITIGASTRYNDKLAADFSNYGKTKVDIFAPGFEIYSTVPQSEFKNLQGTSMAAPMVAGAAAMLKSYFPELTMVQIKDAILKSAKSYSGTTTPQPGDAIAVDFSALSVTGGVVDLPAAVKLCKSMSTTK